MSGIEDRVLALGGMLQALAQVRRIADTGQSETTPVRVALDSVFRIDAADTEAVYGDTASLRTGLRLLRDYLANTNKDEALGKLGLSVLHLERRFSSEHEVATQVGAGIRGLAGQAERLGSAHPDVVAGLGVLQQVFGTRSRPAHRTPEKTGCPEDDRFFGVVRDLLSESAADIR